MADKPIAAATAPRGAKVPREHRFGQGHAANQSRYCIGGTRPSGLKRSLKGEAR